MFLKIRFNILEKVVFLPLYSISYNQYCMVSLSGYEYIQKVKIPILVKGQIIQWPKENGKNEKQ